LPTGFRLQIPQPLYAALLAQAQAELPNECCGLLAGVVTEGGAGRVGLVRERYPLVNALASPTAFESEPRSMFVAVRDMERRGLDILAVYHSHPSSGPVPSRTDLARNYSPEVVNLIISLMEGEPRVRGWWLTGEGYREAAWECVAETEFSP
jgi:proteasome lid subunit RPN8/RPN11